MWIHVVIRMELYCTINGVLHSDRVISGRGHLINESKLPRQLLGSTFWEFRPKSAALIRSLPVRRRTCSPVSGFPGGRTALGEGTEHLRAGG